ncbi:hypothetical protein QTP70_012708 [Hemibagrus guttatus]|uniref:Tight junction-associated protein 1 domain-containing protein n=1 Tax=Hemibagrus guttatus TaxID=175788 RepID=A0AAE0RFC1_9TELE|nr:hypothetical protein QTP70_012708 [Hemibagrus guttatus]
MMTSAAPARKPYRKAPPQHRETRQNQTIFRDDLSGSPTATCDSPAPAQHAPSKVICLQDYSSILQGTQFTSPYPKYSTKYSLEGPDVFSSSWSDSELEVSSLSSLELIVLPPPRIFSHGAVGVPLPPKPNKGMNRFISRSEDLLLKSIEEDRPRWKGSQKSIRCISPAHSNRSGERSLAFKEEAEIFAPRVEQHSLKSVFPTRAPPTKGILKQTQYLRVHAKDSLRKSKSAEILGRSHSHKRKPKSMSLDRERKPGVSAPGLDASTSSASPSSVLPEWKMQLLEEKLKFSQFLDEITYRILSPASLNLLGYNRQTSKGIQAQLSPCQQAEPKKHKGKEQERNQPWGECDTPQDREAMREKTGRSKKRHFSLKKDKLEQESEKWHMGPKMEGAQHKSKGSDYGQIGVSGNSRHSSDTEWDGRNRQGVQQQPPPHQSAQLELRTQPKDTVNKSGLTKALMSTIHKENENIPVSETAFLVLSQFKESVSDADKIKILQQQNEDLRRHLTHTTHKMEAMEEEFESRRHYMQTEMGRTRDDLEKMKDKFRRLQNSYTASQRANQDLEEKLHALLRKVERDKKTMDQEIVELTNKLVDAKNTIDKLEELNERYRQDCNLAVQLLKCNKSHFRNHKFADLPYELQEMVNKHMKSSLPDKTQSPQGAHGQDPDTLSLTPADVVPTSVIARVLEKPEPLVLNSAQSSSSGRPVAEDVFVHVDMTGSQNESAGRENGGPGQTRLSTCTGSEQSHVNGMFRSPDGQSADSGAAPSFEKLNPYPTPPPPHPLYPGRKVIEFSSDDKVKIPKNSPLPNCTYATRQAISLSLVQNEEEAGERQRTVPNSPAVSDGGWRSGTSSSSGGGHVSHPRTPQQSDFTDPLSSQSSPFSSPPQPPSAFASSGSSEEDLLTNWQRMFVEKIAPSSEGTLVNRTSFSSETVKELQRTRSSKSGRGASDRGILRGAYSDGEEGSSTQSWTASRESSLDTDTSSIADLRTKRGEYGATFSQEESEQLLLALDNDDGASGDTMVMAESSPVSAKQQEFAEDCGSVGSPAEERDILPQDFPIISPRVLAGLEDYTEKPPAHHHHSGSTRPQKSPKRMGIHHLHRKDSLTRAQEHGNLLD